MPSAFQVPPVPVAFPGQFIRLEPDDVVHKVRSLEQLATLDPVDFGTIGANGGQATDSNGDTEVEVNELEIRQNQLGQYWIYPLSLVNVEVRQTGAQDLRFDNGEVTGKIDVFTPEPMREVWVLEEGDPLFIVTNDQPYSMDVSYVEFTGYKYLLGPEKEEAPGNKQAISVPTKRLEQQSQRNGVGGPRGTQGRATGGSR